MAYLFEVDLLVSQGRITHTHLLELNNWQKMTSLPQLNFQQLALFLLSCEDDVESAKRTVESYFKIRSNAPEIFDGWDIDAEDLQKITKVIITASIEMSNLTVLHVFKLQDTNYRNFDLLASYKLALMLITVSQMRKEPPSKLIVILDMQGINFMHLTCLRLGAIKKFVDYMQEGLPLEIDRIYVLNTNYLFQRILTVVKVFMKSELLKRIIPCPPSMDMEVFFTEHVPARYMPAEYGGNLPETGILHLQTMDSLRNLKDFFKEEENIIKNYRKK